MCWNTDENNTIAWDANIKTMNGNTTDFVIHIKSLIDIADNDLDRAN